MRGDWFSRVVSLVALSISVVALVVAGRACVAQQDHARQMEALGDLIRDRSGAGRPIMDIGPPGGGRPELDRGD